jgi:hypothetical protein
MVTLCILREMRNSVASFCMNDPYRANGVTATLYNNIWEVPISNLNLITGYPERGLSWFLGPFRPYHFLISYIEFGSRDSSVGILTGWTTGVQFPGEATDFSLPRSVEAGSGAQLASYSIFVGSKAAGA